jgi:hypothetical protein
VVWRRKTGKVNETAVTPVPNTDLILLTRDLGSKSRLEAVDVLSGSRIWESDKVKGDVMQLAVDPESDLIAVVLVKIREVNSAMISNESRSSTYCSFPLATSFGKRSSIPLSK